MAHIPNQRKTLALPFLATFAVLTTLAAYATSVSAQLDTPIEYANYRNYRWHYSLAVPATMMVRGHQREGGGQTVQFMDAGGDKESIISAWPYTQYDLRERDLSSDKN